MKYRHQQLAKGSWFKLSLVEQMANVGSEISRTINWKQTDQDYSKQAFYRALELLSLTIDDPKNKLRLKEICRAKEMLIDWFLNNPVYKSTDQQWQQYFLQFNYVARQSLRSGSN